MIFKLLNVWENVCGYLEYFIFVVIVGIKRWCIVWVGWSNLKKMKKMINGIYRLIFCKVRIKIIIYICVK